MAGRQELFEAIDIAVQQLTAIADQIRVQPNGPSQEGDWTIHEALCHIAATSHYDQLIRRVEKRGGTFPTLDQLAVDNRQQIVERIGRSVDDLLDEAFQGYARAHMTVHQLSDEQLAEPAVTSGDGPATMSDLIMVVYMHAQGHIASFEQSVGPTR